MTYDLIRLEKSIHAIIWGVSLKVQLVISTVCFHNEK